MNEELLFAFILTIGIISVINTVMLLNPLMKKPQLKLMKVRDVKEPKFATPGSACVDIWSPYGGVVDPGKTKRVKTGLKPEIPKGYVFLLFSRSGQTNFLVRLSNCVGVIDADFRGELEVALHNDSNKPYSFYSNTGEKGSDGKAIAQGMLLRLPRFAITLVKSISKTERGEGGFGHTGI